MNATRPQLNPLELLDFIAEHEMWTVRATNEQVVRARFGIGMGTFWMRVHEACSDPEIRAARPTIVQRLDRLREQRRAIRRASGLTSRELDRQIPHQGRLPLATSPPRAVAPGDGAGRFFAAEPPPPVVATDDPASYEDPDIDPDWTARGWAAMRRLIPTGRAFTADDVRQLAGDAPNNAAMGALFTRAHNENLIRRIGQMPSARTGKPVGVWIAIAARDAS